MNKKTMVIVLIVGLLLNPTLAHCDSLITNAYENDNNKLQIIEELVKNNINNENQVLVDDVVSDKCINDKKNEDAGTATYWGNTCEDENINKERESIIIEETKHEETLDIELDTDLIDYNNPDNKEDNSIDSTTESNKEQESIKEIKCILTDPAKTTNKSLIENLQDNVNNNLNEENYLATPSYTDNNENLIDDDFTVSSQLQLELIDMEDFVIASDSITNKNLTLGNKTENVYITTNSDILTSIISTKSNVEETKLYGDPTGTIHILPRNWYDAFGGSKTYVTKIIFQKGGTIPSGSSWNISSTGLMGYYNSGVVIIYAPNANDNIKATNCNHLFSGYGTDILVNNFCNLTEIENLSYLDVSNATSMNGMFSLCSSLQSIDLSNFDTSGVTDMGSMFNDCTTLTVLDLSTFDTSNVTTCTSMFHTCSSLTTIYVSNSFDLSSATSHGAMFTGDTNLVGQKGTTCDGVNFVNKAYARIDGGPTSATPGYFSLKPGLTVASISVATSPSKLYYMVGEHFDPSGLIIHQHYDDGHIEDVVYNSTTAAEFIFNPATTSDLTIADTQVTITHSGQSCNQNITVIEPASISVKPNTNLKVKYAINESFDPTNLYINVTYSDTTTIETVSYTGNESDFSFNPSILDTAGASIPVTITWTNNGNDFTCTQNVEVVELSTISVNLPPATTRYMKGTNFDPTGLKINLNYSDSTTDTVTYSTSTSGGFTFNGESTLILNTVGNPFVITIGYAGKTCTQNVIVAELSSISITTHATKLNYNAGETFDPTGLVITLTYSDNVTEPIAYNTTTSADFTFSPSGALTRTGNVITIQYKTFNTMTMEETLNVKELTSITIATNPTKLSYASGQSLNPNGLVLTLTYTDSNNAVTTDTATYNSTTQNKFVFNPSGTAITTGNVIVTYDGKTGVNMQPTFPITVRQVASISIVNKPSTTSYNVGSKLNPNGLLLRVNYEDGTNEIVSYSSNNASDFTFNPSTSTNLNTGHSSVTVTYGGKSTSFAISVTQSSGGYVPSGGGGNNGGGGGGGGGRGGGGAGLPKAIPVKYIESNFDDAIIVSSTDISWNYDSSTECWELLFKNGRGIARFGFYTITYVIKENINGLVLEKTIYKTYYFDSNGHMFYGWLHTLDNNWYFFDTDIANLGTMIVTSWKKIDGKWYYFDKDGKLLVNATTPDGYKVDENGVWIE